MSGLTSSDRATDILLAIAISYANGNLASQKFIDRAILDDKTIYPDDAVMKRLYTISAHDAKTQRLMNRLWTRIKTGK